MAEVEHNPVRALRRLKRGDTRLKCLGLYDKKYKDSEVSELFDYLIEHPDRLIGASFVANGIGDTSGVKIAQWIKKSRTVQSLLLMNNDFGEPTYIAMAEALHTNSSLHELMLFGNQIVDTERVLMAFAVAIQINPFLVDCNWSLFNYKNEFTDLKKASPPPHVAPSMLQFLLSTHAIDRFVITCIRYLS